MLKLVEVLGAEVELLDLISDHLIQFFRLLVHFELEDAALMLFQAPLIHEVYVIFVVVGRRPLVFGAAAFIRAFLDAKVARDLLHADRAHSLL